MKVERPLFPHLRAGHLRERAEGLEAARRGRADQSRAGRETSKQVGQGLGGRVTAIVEGAAEVGVLPVGLAGGLGVAEQDQRHGVRGKPGEVG